MCMTSEDWVGAMYNTTTRNDAGTILFSEQII